MERTIDSILDTGGRQLSPDDRQFVTTLYKELETFQYQAPKDRALMFHPLGGYQRYLIHKVTEVFPKLTSFSIGDETDRRTVVCFKNKRKEQQLQQARALAASPQDQRGRGSFKSSPGRSRESSRGRPKSMDRASKSKKGKPDGAHLPRPLRQKKNIRSRSLHASPTREHDQPYYTDDDKRRKKNPNKPLSRSASMRDTRKNRSASRPTSPPDSHRKSRTLPKSATELSMERRGHGLQLEGKVVNGDVEDPYNQDSDADRHRNDVEALKKHKRPSSRSSTRKEKVHNKTEPIKKHEKITKADVIPQKNGDFTDSSLSTEDHEYVVMKKPTPSTTRRSKEKTPSKSRENSTKRKSKKEKERIESPNMSDSRRSDKIPNGYVDQYLPTGSEVNDYLSLDDDGPLDEYDKTNDQIPPPYISPESSAARNLNRIRRSDSTRSGSSTRSKTPVPPVVTEVEKKPKSMKKKKSKDVVDGKTHTPRKHVEPEEEVEEVKPKQERRKSTSSTKGKSPKKKKHKEEKKKAEAVLAQPAVETEKNQKSAKANPEDNLVASDGTLYMPLPSATVNPSTEKPVESFYVNQPEPTASTITTPSRCDSEVQTEMRGTLPLDKSKQSKPVVLKEDASQASSSPYQTANSSSQPISDMTSPPNSTSTDPAKFVEDFCKMMLNFQNMALNTQREKEKSNPPPPSSQLPEPKVNPFAAFYPGSQSGQQPTPPHSLYSQFPPHVSYQLYMSWMAAYYAGATGSWPPPPPFASYPQGDKPNVPYEYHNFSSVFQPHQNYPSSRDGYSSSTHPSPQKPYESFDNSDMMYSSSFQPSSRKGTEVYGSDRSQSPFEHLASVSMSSNLDDNKSNTEKPSSVRSKDRQGVKSGSNSTVASAKVNTVDAVLTHNDGADTDASSITSSSTKPEVAVQSGPKGGVMVYVRSSSQSNSRANSTISGEDGSSGDHLVTNQNDDGDSSQPRKMSVSSQRKFSRQSSSRSSVASSGNQQRGSRSSSVQGHDIDSKPPSYETCSQPPGSNREPNQLSKDIPRIVMHKSESEGSSAEGLHESRTSSYDERTPAIVLLSSPEPGPLTPPPDFKTVIGMGSVDKVCLHSIESAHSSTVSTSSADGKSDNADFPDPPNDDVLNEVDAITLNQNLSHEEVFLSLSRAPLAAMDDESDLSRSAASSFSSIDAKATTSQEKASDKCDEIKENGFPEPGKGDHITNGKQSDSPTNYDYYNYKPNEEMYKSEPYNRIAEIYDFEPNFKDANIVPHFSKYNGFKLWWVDDTHALGVFSSTDHHDHAITRDIPNLRIRPMSQASAKSKKKAKLRIEDFGEKRSTEPRPKTDSSVAKRMITNALGGSSKKSDTGSLKQPKKKRGQERRKSSTT